MRNAAGSNPIETDDARWIDSTAADRHRNDLAKAVAKAQEWEKHGKK